MLWITAVFYLGSFDNPFDLLQHRISKSGHVGQCYHFYDIAVLHPLALIVL